MCEDKDVACNNGTCSNTENGFHCTCPDDYVGVNCETPKVDCTEVTCENGATCTNDTDMGFICHCRSGYTGQKCETDIDECASNPCHEHYGQCVDHENKYECQCSSCNCTSGVEQYVDCIFGIHYSTKQCGDARAAQGDHTTYFLPHPYKCNKFVGCYNNGTYGTDQDCQPTYKFDPAHNPSKYPCKPQAEVPQCVDI
ncbi:hypothetical protein NP493_910g01068 [Ridgeia piscesae]|uniref:Uncharacterized protein n=1 Tax=Ridgeia piscesae TaxID=27915 RepID=A0AAD9KK01_RIDPI|nr:hypothetical protein NP493_910g01068 [Ridgeia piscesae]